MLHSTTTQVQTWLASTNPIPVVGLPDPVVDALGHDVESSYTEAYWLPVIGPTALWALRRLNRWLEDTPNGFPLALAPFARELGLGEGTSSSSPIVRSLARLVSFGLADVRGSQLMVRRRVPPLARRHVLRLPSHLVEQHRQETEAVAGTEPRSAPPAPAPSKVAGGRTGTVGEAGPSAHRAPTRLASDRDPE